MSGVAIIVAALLLATPAGTVVLVWALERLTPGELRIGASAGTVSAGLDLGALHWRDGDTRLSVDALRIDIALPALARGRLRIDALAASGVTLTPGPRGAAGPVPSRLLPSLPFDVAVSAARIEDLRVAAAAGAAPLRIARIDGALRYPRDGPVTFDRLRVQAGDATVELAGQILAAPATALDLSFEVSAGRAGPGRIAGRGRLQGRLDDLALELAVQAPVQAVVTARADLLQAAPAVELLGRMDPPQQLLLPAAWPQAIVAGEVQAQVAAGVLAARVRLTGETPQVGAWRLEVDMAGEPTGVVHIERLALGAADGAQLNASGQVNVAAPARPDMDLRGNWTGLRWPSGGAPELRSDHGQFTLRGTPQRYEIDLDTALAGPTIGSVAVTARVRGGRSGARVEQLEARTGTGAVTVSGTVNWTGAARAALVADWQAMAVTLADGRTLASDSGHVALDGGPDAYRIDGAFGLRLADLPAGRVQIAARGDRARLDVDALTIHVRTGELTGAGALSWAGTEPEWRLQLDAHSFDPGWLAADWPGEIALVAGLHGRGGDGVLEIEHMRGTLRGLAFSARGEISRREGRYRIGNLALESGRSRVDVAGGVGGPEGLLWKIDAPDLGDLWPGARGLLTGHGRLGGNLLTPRVSGHLHAEAIALREYRAAQVEADVDVDVNDGGPMRIAITARDLLVGAVAVGSAAVHSRGTPAAHEIELDVDAPAGRIALTATGGLSAAEGWQGELSRGRVERDGHAPLVLEAPAALALRPGRGVLARQCWQAEDDGRVCFQGDADGSGHWQAALALERVALGRLGVPRLRSTGLLDAELDLAGSAAAIASARGELELGAGGLEIELDRDGGWRLDHQGARLRLDTDGGRIRARLEVALAGPQTVPAHVVLSLPAPIALLDLAGTPVDGRFDIELPALAPFAALSTELAEVDGQATIAGTVAGTLVAPQIDGALDAAVRAATVPRLGIAVANGRLHARVRPSGEVEIDGGLDSGGGRLGIDGRATLATLRDWTMTLGLRGERIEVVNLPEARVLASPDLTLTLRPRRVAVAGRIAIPEAHISPRSTADTVEVSEDIVVSGGDDEQTRESRWAITSDVTITLGEQVQIDAMGFTGRLTGEVHAIDEVGQVTTGTGVIRIADGRFEAYGQKLELERGRIILAGGPMDDPAVDARAVRTVASVKVGVRARGRLRQPVLSLFSTPKMADSEVLSYLVLGHGFSESTAGDARVLADAATSMGLKGGDLLSRKIGRAFGLDEVSVSANPAADELSLNVGKYLSPRLYVGYGMGLLDRSNVVRLRYGLTPRWSVEAETGTKTGADVLYSIER
ncbi:MAG: translocation/assembly module TamB domain-containing protein [Gammaproteobacteria bacterium]|nr:translocation/assembly module TamB domain-containing protein [Gammaproteobacteria bacterium]